VIFSGKICYSWRLSLGVSGGFCFLDVIDTGDDLGGFFPMLWVWMSSSVFVSV
jgi:hypothetical protein